MTLMRYEPYRSVSQLNRDINRMFDSYLRDDSEAAGSTPVYDFAPAVDIREEPARYVLHADLPGVKADDIDISLEDGVLTIRGERKLEKNVEAAGYKRVERMHGSFYRSFTLPDTADHEGVAAAFKDGVLEVSIKKQEKAKPKKITVQA
jgi:HSP20 family protein